MGEQAIQFDSADKQLIGIAHQHSGTDSDTGVLIVVGGPQTRVGSHRQFVLLARFLADNGVPCLRFDCAGMGDSDGEEANYLDIAGDIQAAVAQCKQHLGVSKVIIWGLCDAASAALLYAMKKPTDDIVGMILLNPWVRSEQGEAKTIVKHYYLNRLKDKAFWRKVFKLEFNLFASFKDLMGNLAKMSKSQDKQADVKEATSTEDNYINHMLQGLNRYQGEVRLIISGNDLTATEFLELLKSSKEWQRAVDQKVVDRHTMPDANHTFSSRQWRSSVEQTTLRWINQMME